MNKGNITKSSQKHSYVKKRKHWTKIDTGLASWTDIKNPLSLKQGKAKLAKILSFGRHKTVCCYIKQNTTVFMTEQGPIVDQAFVSSCSLYSVDVWQICLLGVVLTLKKWVSMRKYSICDIFWRVGVNIIVFYYFIQNKFISTIVLITVLYYREAGRKGLLVYSDVHRQC